jgi:DNA-directed RNA polymerase subunit M/transcription elongation factor TFIIS
MTDIEEMCPNCGSMAEQVYNTANDFYSCQLCGASYNNEEMELPNGDVVSL